MRRNLARPRGRRTSAHERDPVIAVADGAVELGGRPVLRGIDLDRRTPARCVAVLGANGSGKSTLVRTMLGLVPHVPRGGAALRHPARPVLATGSGSASCRSGSPPPSGVPASVREVVASGRLARRRPFLPPSRADRAAVEAAIDRGRPRRPGPRRRLHALRRPAAAGADRPGPGRRARPARPRRADRRGRPAAASRSSPTRCSRLVDARRHDRAGRPRARPARRRWSTGPW